MTIIPNSYGYTCITKNATVAWAQAQQVINDLLSQNVKRLRFQIPWGGSTNKMEWQAPVGSTYYYNWTALDDLVARCEASGIWLQFCIQNPPSWHLTTYSVPGGGSFAWATPADMAKFAGDIVTRYSTPVAQGGHGVLPSLEFGNEDADPFGQANNIRDYGGYIAGLWIMACAPAVLAINPNLYVSTPALLQQSTTHYATWLNYLYSTGAGQYMRNTNIHYYKGNEGPPENNGFAFSQAWQACQQGNAANGYPNQKIWITETGWDMNSDANPAPPSYPSPATTWGYFQQMLDEARFSGQIEVMMWYTIGTNDTKSLTVHGGADGQPEEYQNPLFGNFGTYAGNYPNLQAAPANNGIAVTATSRDGLISVGSR